MRDFNEQEKSFINLVVRGVPPNMAARSLGMDDDQGIVLANDPDVHKSVTDMRKLYTDRLFGDKVEIQFTKDDAALMYLEAHRKSATATEEIKAIDSMVKLFGIATPEKKEIAIKHGSVEEFENLDTNKLLELSGTDIILSPEDYIVHDPEQ